MLSEKKRILLVTAGFPFGEWERGFLATEFQYLCDRFQVTVLAVGREDPLIYPVPESVRVERFLYPKAGKSALLRHIPEPEVRREMIDAAKGAPLKTALSRIKLINAYYHRAKQVEPVMERLIREQRIDMIYTYWGTEPAVAACLLKKRIPGLRFVTRFHGHDLFRERKGSNWQPFRPLLARWADRLYFACRMGQGYFNEAWGGDEKSRLCYLGCAGAERTEHRASDVLRIVSCSNLIALKRVDCIIDALALLPESVQVRWDHFGDGPERQGLEEQAGRKLKDNVLWKFHGRVPNEALRDHYRSLDPDVFLTTSSTEGGVPVSIQEAFSMGIPAIGTAAGGIPEIVVPEETGFLLSGLTNARETADALLAFHSLPAEQKEVLSRNALGLWQTSFDARHNAGEFIADLERVLNASCSRDE